MAHKGQQLHQLPTCDQSWIKGEYSCTKESIFSHLYESAERQQRSTIDSFSWSLAASNNQKNLPTRTFHSLLNSNFVLMPQPYNDNTTNMNRHQEISTSPHGNSLQHQHEITHREILPSCHGNSLRHQHQTNLAPHDLFRQQQHRKPTRRQWQRQKQGKHIV